MTEDLVKAYYTGTVLKEWRRLVQDTYHRVEFETTVHFLEKYLPREGLVLDAGGGPGRYTIELARRGYQVVLYDYTPANLAFAKRRVVRAHLQPNLGGYIEGSLVDLSFFSDNTFDAVLCTGGPLSHIVNPDDRMMAGRELVRVAKPGAPIFVSVMNRLSLLVVELVLFQDEIEMPHFTEIRDTGDYFGGRGFTACHFYLPEELRSDFNNYDVEIIEIAGLEGLGSNHQRAVNLLARNPKRWSIWMDTHLKTCTHPAVVGSSEHMLLICRKKFP